jgi:hypothetical protein
VLEAKLAAEIVQAVRDSGYSLEASDALLELAEQARHKCDRWQTDRTTCSLRFGDGGIDFGCTGTPEGCGVATLGDALPLDESFPRDASAMLRAEEPQPRAPKEADDAKATPAPAETRPGEKQHPTTLSRNLDLLREECGWSNKKMADAVESDRTNVADHLSGAVSPHPKQVLDYVERINLRLKALRRLRKPLLVADLKDPELPGRLSTFISSASTT